jgi:hypothetical protein
MSRLFGSLGAGKTVRAFGALAAAATLGAIAFGEEAERYAEARRPAVFETSPPNPSVACFLQPPLNAVDYATTGSVEPAAQRDFVVLGPCGEPSDQR